MSTLSTGSQGSEVKTLQRDLTFLKYDVAIDGDFGDGTSAAVTRFQNDQNLTADGEAGPITWAALDFLVPNGMDISHHNIGIDCNNLPPHIQFVYCKASDGQTFKDPKFNAYVTALQQNKVINGAYHFITFQASAEAQVDNFMGCGYDFSAEGALPPALDVEWQVGQTDAETAALNQYIKDNRATCIQLVSDILQLVATKTGRTPVVYTAKSFMSEFLNNTTAFADYPLWIPAYQDSTPGLPPGWDSYAIWQYYGAPDGVRGLADLDLFNGTLDDLKKFALIGAAV